MDNLPRNATEFRAWWAENAPVAYGFCWCGCGEKTAIASKTQRSRKTFAGEPYRYIIRHPALVVTQTISERLWPKVSPQPGGCWHWTGFLDKAGYGRIRSEGGRMGESLLAHRVTYELKYGDIPKGLELDHLCRNRRCVNPDHLEAVTHQENVARGARHRAAHSQD